jgi:hypothetical protein
MLVVDGVRFREWNASSEDEFESYVVSNSKTAFGDESLYFSVKPRLRSSSTRFYLPKDPLNEFTFIREKLNVSS